VLILIINGYHCVALISVLSNACLCLLHLRNRLCCVARTWTYYHKKTYKAPFSFHCSNL